METAFNFLKTEKNGRINERLNALIIMKRNGSRQ